MPIAVLENYRIFVNGVNVTAAAYGERWLSLNIDRFSAGRAFFTTGTLTLVAVQGFAANFFSPRKNTAQWIRGNTVTIDMQFGDATWVRVFTGYILRRPSAIVEQDKRLRIHIGCELAYRRRNAEVGDKAGVSVGTSTTRTDIINSIWSGIGGTGAWSGTIAEFPVNYNIPKYSGSFVDQMGEIAFTAGYGLYCDRNGSLQASQFDIGGVTFLAERTYSNLPSLVPVDGSEPVASEVKVTLVGREVESTALSRTVGPLVTTGVLRKRIGVGGTDDITIITGTQRRVTITETLAGDRKSRTIITTVEEPYFISESDYQLAVKNKTTVTETYSAASDGKLLTRTTSIERDPKHVGLGLLTITDIRENGTNLSVGDLLGDGSIEEQWLYDGEVPNTYIRREFDVAVTLSGGFADRDDYLRETKTETYTFLGGEEWLKIVEVDSVQFRIAGSNELITAVESEQFQGPEYAPRAPVRHPPIARTQQILYEGSQAYNVVGATDEPALYEFDYGVSPGQAQEITELLGAVLVGRDFGWQATQELTRAWVEGWTPASKVKITLPDGDVISSLVDGVNISVSQASAIVSYGVTELGVLGTGATSIIPPYAVVQDNKTAKAQASGSSGVTELAATITSGSTAMARAFGTPATTARGSFGSTAKALASGSSETTGLIQPVPVLGIANGGTGGFTAAQARENLGLSLPAGDLTGTWTNPLLLSQYKPLTTKGDIYVHNGSTPVRLPVGATDGHVLKINASEATGLEWAAETGGGGGGSGGVYAYQSTVTTASSQSSVTFSSLSGSDGYQIIGVYEPSANGYINLFVESDTTATNYNTREKYSSTSGAGTPVNDTRVMFAYNGQTWGAWFHLYIHRDPINDVIVWRCNGGYNLTGGNSQDGTQFNGAHTAGGDTSITTLQLSASTGNFLDNSVFHLYKLVTS